MKTKVLTMTFILIAALCQSQSKLSLQIIEKSTQDLNNPTHWHLFEVKNPSNKTINAQILTKTEQCKNLDSRQPQTELEFEAFSESKKALGKSLLIKPNGTTKFYIQSNRNAQTALGSWNCAVITLVNKLDNSVISENVELRSFVPNPSNYE